MKKPVLERSMFIAAMGKPPKSESRGILTGLEDFDMESEKDDDLEDYEERTPDNLEIIANNLRGDIRSMDERYMELAQMVGESAFETPEEVVALMQSQFAQQQQPPMPAPPAPAQQGIAGLPGASAPPPGGIMSGIAEPQPTPQGPPPGVPMPPQGGMPQGMPAPVGMAQGMQQPVGMAQGGLVYRANGSGPGAESSRYGNLDERLRLLQSQNRPGMLSRFMTGAGNLAENMDERTRQFLSRQLQTTGPTSASGNPIPFVDKSGRFYQPAGGTNPNMASRGMPMPSKFNLGRFATRFGGPVGILGGLATDALIASDPSRGQLYGSMFELETGAGAADRPGFASTTGNVPPSEPPLTEDQIKAVREMGFMGTQDYSPRLGYVQEAIEAATPGAMLPIEGPPAPPVVRREFPSVKAEPPAPKTERDIYRDRVREKMDIYAEFLGSDPEMRKAQALFMLAEAALNVAGATGRSTAERLAKGLKGLPAGMSALGAEAEKERRSIAAAAITSVEQDMAEERKIAGAIAREYAKKGTNIPPKVMSIFSSLKARFPNEDENKLLQESFDIDNGTLVRSDKTGEVIDTATGGVYRSPYKPLSQNSVGYLDPNMPYVRTTNETLSPVTPSERENLFKRRGELQERIEGSNQMISMIYGDTIGFLPTIQSGVSKLTLATVGDIGLGLTDVQKNAIRDNLRLYREELIKLNLRNAGRPAVYDQKKMEDLIRDPNALFQSQELLLANVSNLQREDINELARIDSQLFGTPVKQLERVPVGSKTDPIEIRPNTNLLLDQIFTNRPDAAIWTLRPSRTDPNKKENVRITGKEYFAQRQAQ